MSPLISKAIEVRTEALRVVVVLCCSTELRSCVIEKLCTHHRLTMTRTFFIQSSLHADFRSFSILSTIQLGLSQPGMSLCRSIFKSASEFHGVCVRLFCATHRLSQHDTNAFSNITTQQKRQDDITPPTFPSIASHLKPSILFVLTAKLSFEHHRVR